MPAALPSMPATLQIALFVLVVSAAVADLKTRRIPNAIAAGGTIAGLALNVYLYGAHGLLSALLGALLGVALFLAIYLAGGMGAGDVKLLAAVGAIVGPQSLLVIFVLTGILGGAAALTLLLVRGRVSQSVAQAWRLVARILHRDWAEVTRLSDRRAAQALSLPYAAVIAVGALLFLFAVRHPVG